MSGPFGSIRTALQQCLQPRTRIAPETDLAAVSLASPCTLYPIKPPLLDCCLQRFTDISFGIDDPDSVVRVEGNGEEDWVLGDQREM